MISAFKFKILSFFNRDFVVPKKIRLEASSYCQLRCPSCPTTTGHIHPAIGSGFLKISDFKDLVDKNKFLTHVELSNYGEIFLNPDFMEILKYSYEKGIKLTANNGVNLNDVKDEVLEGLVKYQFRSLFCSIDGASQETYVKYRVRGDFEKVINNIKKINAFKAKYNSQYPKLYWNFIIFGHNEHEIEKAKELAGELNMEFNHKLSWDSDFSPIKTPEVVKKQTGIEVTSREEYLQRYNEDYKQSICSQLWKAPMVNWDGKLLGCCRNFWGDFGDNVFEKGLLASVNNPKIRYARRMLRGEEEPSEEIPCTTCNIYLSMKKYSKWIKE